jgi:hypothetical protein
MMKITGIDCLRSISASVEILMIKNTSNPFSFYSVLSTQSIPSSYVIIIRSKDKGHR